MRSALLIASKDLLRSVRDRSVIMLAIVAPLGLAFILSTVLGNADSGSLHVRFAVVDQDKGPVASTFVNGALRSLAEHGIATIDRQPSVAAATRMARDGSVAAAFILPAGLSRAVQSGRGARLSVVTDPGSVIGSQIAASVARGYATELNAVRLSIATAASLRGEQPTRSQIAQLRRRAAATEMPGVVSQTRVGSREFDTKTFFAAGMAVFFLFFTTQMGAVSLLRERSEGTLARLLAAPLSRASVVAGKALFTFVLGVGSMAVLVVASKFLMGARWGNPAGVGALIVAGVFAAMGVQSLVTTLARTDAQAAGYGSIVGVTLGLLGGTFFPLSQAPGFISRLSFFTPHAWLMRGFGELSGGVAGLSDVVPSLAALLAFGAVTGTVALVRSKTIVAA